MKVLELLSTQIVVRQASVRLHPWQELAKFPERNSNHRFSGFRDAFSISSASFSVVSVRAEPRNIIASSSTRLASVSKGTIVVVVSGRPDAVTVDLLARLQLRARRLGQERTRTLRLL